MLPKYHKKYLTQVKEKHNPEHVNTFEVKNRNDVIILYSQFEDLFPSQKNKDTIGTFIPQWVGMGLVDDKSGFCFSFKTPTVCQSYSDIKDLSLKELKNK